MNRERVCVCVIGRTHEEKCVNHTLCANFLKVETFNCTVYTFRNMVHSVHHNCLVRASIHTLDHEDQGCDHGRR